MSVEALFFEVTVLPKGVIQYRVDDAWSGGGSEHGYR